MQKFEGLRRFIWGGLKGIAALGLLLTMFAAIAFGIFLIDHFFGPLGPLVAFVLVVFVLSGWLS